jgi:hypothetical protein
MGIKLEVLSTYLQSIVEHTLELPEQALVASRSQLIVRDIIEFLKASNIVSATEGRDGTH